MRLVTNDVETLDDLFRKDPRTIRYGLRKTCMVTKRWPRSAPHARRSA